MSESIPRFLKFAVVGSSGIIVNESILLGLTEYLRIYYLFSAMVATEFAVLTNFTFNEFWTFKDLRKANENPLKRLIKFNAVALGGMIINIGILAGVKEFLGIHYLIANIAGIGGAVFWNYFLNLAWTWKKTALTKMEKIDNPTVSLIVPTYNEGQNIKELIETVETIFEKNKINGEIIIVDDNSQDGTQDRVRGLVEKYGNIKLIVREGKLGLSTAVIKGFESASGDILGVCDADFSHPLDKIPDLIKPLVENRAQITIGSRYVKGGSIPDWPLHRRVTSRGAVLLALPLTRVKDPVSGYFFLRKETIEGITLSPTGFKILLEVLVRGRYSRVEEVPITFTDREKGKSKLDIKEYLNYLRHCFRLYLSILK